MSDTFQCQLAPRMATLEPSPFQILQQATSAAQAAGRKVLALSVGEPCFHTPDIAKRAGIRAILDNDTRYTPTDGTPALKAAIREKLARDNGLDYAPEEIVVSMGGVQAIFNLLLASVGPGDEVILPAPFFPPYISAIRLVGATPVVLPTYEKHGFAPQAEHIEAALTPRSRWLVLNSPSNPAGAVIDEAGYRAIAEVVRRHPKLMVLSDDMYETIRFDGAPCQNILNVAPDLAGRTVVLNGVSKTYSMTGWRMAYLAGPRDLMSAVALVSLASSFSPNSISQAAAIAALTGSQFLVPVQAQAYRARRDIAVGLLKDVPGLSFAVPGGTYFLFVNCQDYLGGALPDDVAFVLKLLEMTDVATMPGSGFGTPGYFRISFAVPEDVLREALSRIADACARLRQPDRLTA